MNLARRISTATLPLLFSTFLLMGASARIAAQDQRDDAKPAPANHPEAAKPSQNEPEPRPEAAKPSKQKEDKAARDEDKAAKDNKVSKHEEKPEKQEDVKRQTEQGEKACSGQSDERAQSNVDRPGGHIPDDKFHSSFGRQHTFVMQRPTVVEGRPTFQYSGYSFILVDAWPEDWAYSDECYIDSIDGEYFLFDLAHPDVRFAVVVVL